ncbi:hypothetical protein K1T71_012922 [Dendrolimus kikuchii]|uniref:Uncharacterized protein n=1 Tax=Dendrolimus kikuchii TaxID=765133 RepID=A0ACC1CIR4_9NEOP|nr:hypothetical protein K1T71_012922 [Dendrolimus kikuchii]
MSTDNMNQGADLTQDSIEIKEVQFKGNDDENIRDLESFTARPSAYFSPKDKRPLPMPHVLVCPRRNEVYISKWFAYEHFYFLADKFSPRETQNSMSIDTSSPSAARDTTNSEPSPSVSIWGQ